MKRITALMLIILLLLTVVSCVKKEVDDKASETNKAVSDNEQSIFDTEKTPESTSEQTKIQETTVFPTDTPSPETTSAPVTETKVIETTASPVTTVAVTTAPPAPPPPPVPQQATFSVDLSRAESSDVGACVYDGYIYYDSPMNQHGFPAALLRKKISGGQEETVVEHWADCFRVLDGKVYYLLNGNIYRCEADGKNASVIYSGGSISSIEVAGNWIFAIRTTYDGSNGRRQALFMIKTDGSEVIHLKLDSPDTHSSSVFIYGFNRGYCYYQITHNYSLSAGTYTMSAVKQRVDYRVSSPVPQEVKPTNSFIYKGFNYYLYFDNLGEYQSVLGRKYLSYDSFFQHSLSEYYMVSLLSENALTLFEEGGSPSWLNLKDYLVLLKKDDMSLVFYDRAGNSKTVSFLASVNAEYENYGFSAYQDIHGNNVVILLKNTTKGLYKMLMVSPDGSVNEVYDIK